MQLRSSPSSPFGRKVTMATYILGLDDQVSAVLTLRVGYRVAECARRDNGDPPNKR